MAKLRQLPSGSPPCDLFPNAASKQSNDYYAPNVCHQATPDKTFSARETAVVVERER